MRCVYVWMLLGVRPVFQIESGCCFCLFAANRPTRADSIPHKLAMIFIAFISTRSQHAGNRIPHTRTWWKWIIYKQKREWSAPQIHFIWIKVSARTASAAAIGPLRAFISATVAAIMALLDPITPKSRLRRGENRAYTCGRALAAARGQPPLAHSRARRCSPGVATQRRRLFLYRARRNPTAQSAVSLCERKRQTSINHQVAGWIEYWWVAMIAPGQ